jgi:hypothetical protein
MSEKKMKEQLLPEQLENNLKKNLEDHGSKIKHVELG